MSSPNHSPDHAVAAPAAATTLDRLPPWGGTPFHVALVGLTAIFGGIYACAHHDGRANRDAVGCLAFGYANTVLLALSMRWFDHAPLGSKARRVAGLAVFLLMASLISFFVWMTNSREPSLPFKVLNFFLVAAPPVAAYIYVVFVLGEDYA